MKSNPFQWPVALSAEILKNKESVDPELYKQAIGYQKQLSRLLAEGNTPVGAAKLLQKQGVRIHGWSKETITRSLFPAGGWTKENLSKIHMPSVPPSFDPGFISRWNREALTSRLAIAVKQGPYDPVPLPEFYKQIAGRANRFGIGKQLLGRLGTEAPEMLSEALFPTPWHQKALRSAKSILAKPGAARWALGAGALVGAAYALQIGSLFSPKRNQAYNPNEGLTHNGIAWLRRRELTDFGSGYQGDDNSSSILFPTLAAVGGGVAGYLGAYPWSYRGLDLNKYPRLAGLRAVGEKHGFKMLSSVMPSFVNEKMSFCRFRSKGG